MYLVTAGEARFELGEEEVLASQGTIVAVWDPAVRRGASAIEPVTTLIAETPKYLRMSASAGVQPFTFVYQKMNAKYWPWRAVNVPRIGRSA